LGGYLYELEALTLEIEQCTKELPLTIRGVPHSTLVYHLVECFLIRTSYSAFGLDEGM